MEGPFYQVALGVKNPPVNAGYARDAGLIPGLGRSSGGGNGQDLSQALDLSHLKELHTSVRW